MGEQNFDLLIETQLGPSEPMKVFRLIRVVQWNGVLEKLGFRKKANAEEESDECREPRAPMRALVNGAVDAVVKRVPGSNIAGKVQGGLEAKVSTARVRVSVRAAGSHGWRRDAQVRKGSAAAGRGPG